MILLRWVILILALGLQYICSPSPTSTDHPMVAGTTVENASMGRELVHNHQLLPRALWNPNNIASDAIWNAAVLNGGRLTCQMRRTDIDAGKVIGDRRNPPSAASPFSEGRWRFFHWVEESRFWGWNQLDTDPNLVNLREYWGWEKAGRALRFKEGRAIQRIEHWDPFSDEPKNMQHYTWGDRIYWVITTPF